MISGAMINRRSHPVDAGIPPVIFGSRVSFSRIAFESVRRLSNHFRRLIPQFEFARACARNHPLALPAHIPAIKRKWTLHRSISAIPSFLFLLRYSSFSRISLALSAFPHIVFFLELDLDHL